MVKSNQTQILISGIESNIKKVFFLLFQDFSQHNIIFNEQKNIRNTRIHIVLWFLSSCVPYIASFSGLFILIASSIFSDVIT